MSASAADEAAQLFSQSHRLRSHPEDDRSRTPSEPDVDADADAGHEAESHDMPSLTSNYHLPRNTAFDANTGPKGVIADARSYEQAKKQKWLQQNQAPVSRESNGTPYYGQKEVSPVRRDGRSVSPQSQDGEEDDLDFMERWRKTRLSELRTSGDVRNRRQSPSMRRYGTMQTVDAVGYLDAIEKVGRETTVIVCIYDDRVSDERAGPVVPLLTEVAPVRGQSPGGRLPVIAGTQTQHDPLCEATL